MQATKSLKSRSHLLSSTEAQLDLLNEDINQKTFETHLQGSGLFPLKPTQLEIFQVNVGYMCNQTCKHCHVDAGPDRKEIMTKETMQQCLDVMKSAGIKTLDLTGGAPEMNPNFRWFVEEAKKLGLEEIIVRSNLTIIVSNPKYRDLPAFFKKNKVRVISSLPFYQPERTDRQRGEGVFEKSIEALLLLNDVGYGVDNSGLFLDLVYNPSGAFLPPAQEGLEKDFKNELLKNYNIQFNQLFTITNLPVSRFLEYLIASENYEGYMDKLIAAYNPAAAENVMCRNTISIGWDGVLYDCDFNQMLEIEVGKDAPKHINDFDLSALQNRDIATNQHCFGCTAGAGSSCQGQIT